MVFPGEVVEWILRAGELEKFLEALQVEQIFDAMMLLEDSQGHDR